MAKSTQDDLRRLARLGAVARLAELQREASAIAAMFPELRREANLGVAPVTRRGRGGQGAAAAPATAGRPGTSGRKRKAGKRKSMSAAARKAVSERMRKYWAERRKAKSGKKS